MLGGAADLRAGIGRMPDDEARGDGGVGAAHAVAQALELVLFRVFVERRIGGEAQLLGMRGPRHPNVQDDQLRAAGAGDADGVIERPWEAVEKSVGIRMRRHGYIVVSSASPQRRLLLLQRAR